MVGDGSAPRGDIPVRRYRSDRVHQLDELHTPLL
jgi:hypothetical protein